MGKKRKYLKFNGGICQFIYIKIKENKFFITLQYMGLQFARD